MHSQDSHFSLNMNYNKYSFRKVIYMSSPSSGQAVLHSKLVDGWCRVHFPVSLADLTVRIFPWFSPKHMA